MAARIGLVLDCADPEKLAVFWSAALGYTTIGTEGNYVLLRDTDGGQPKLLLQRVAEPKSVKNRMHLDIQCSDLEGEVARLVALGAARQAGPVCEQACTWVVMHDPEGNEFCVCDDGQAC